MVVSGVRGPLNVKVKVKVKVKVGRAGHAIQQTDVVGRSASLCLANKMGYKMYTTPHCSRVVPHPSTERAQTALTSVIGREPVHYG